MLHLQNILLLDILIAACCQDVTTDRVSNVLLAAGWGCGFVSGFGAGAPGGYLVSVLADRTLGGLLPIALLWMLFRFRMLGAGDIKLFSVCGTFLGVQGSLHTMILSIFCGGIMAAVLILIRGNFRSRMHYFLTYLSQFQQEKQIKPYRRPEDRDAVFHFTFAILGGAVLTLAGL